MNALAFPNPPRALSQMLSATRAHVRQNSPGAWNLDSEQGHQPVAARVVDGWLQLLACPLELGHAAITPCPLETLLHWNALLDGNARFGVDARFQLVLRAETPWQDNNDPGPRLSEAWSGIEQGLALLGGNPAPNPVPIDSAADLNDVASAVEWPFHARQNGRSDFQLEAADTSAPAALHQRLDGAMRLSTPLASLSALAELPRRAVSALLLRAGSALRLARPEIAEAHGSVTAELAVHFARPVAAADLRLGLESLAVGIGLLSAEIKMLCHEQTAKGFLEIGNWSPLKT